MIEISTFNLMIAIGILMALYSWIDNRSRLYANIVSAFMAGLVFSFLSAAIGSGVVSTGASASMGYLLQFMSLVMFAYTLFMVYDLVHELFMQKDEAKQAMIAESEDVPVAPKKRFGKIFDGMLVAGLCAVITLSAVYSEAMFRALFVEGGSLSEAMTLYTYLYVHSWIYIIALLMIVATIVIAFKLLSEDSISS